MIAFAGIAAIAVLVIAVAIGVRKLYEWKYFRSQKFKDIKEQISDYINDCNELNEHIEDLKNVDLVFDKTDYGDASYYDSSEWNYKREHLKNHHYAPYVHSCSRTVCNNAKQKPFEYICKYFGVKANEESLSYFESILNNFEAVEEGRENLQIEKEEILQSVDSNIPMFIKKFCGEKLEQNLGFEYVDMSDAYFPRYVFEYVSSGGNASTTCEIIMDVENLNKFVVFLSEKIKFNKSAAGQRALMTSKLRQYIKERDMYTCKQCGISVEQEPHLLLEIDHIVPVSKGGLTTEENLQTLCWRCNRSKGAKLQSEEEQDSPNMLME